MRNKIFLILIVGFIFVSTVSAKVLVLPFKTVKNADKSYFWLSNALSFYISTQLNSINERAFTEAEITNIMDANSISYPYRLTKASAIKIGLINQANKIILGSIDISNTDKSKSEITVHSSIIDIETLKQDFIPIIKGEIKHISLIQKTLFDSIIKKLVPIKKNRINTELDFNNQSYELFIKSLLTRNISEKKHLLINAMGLLKKTKNNGSDLINFELAELFFEEGKFEDAEKYLKSIPTISNILKRKIFLEALILAKKDKLKNSTEQFLKLKTISNFNSYIDNNIGVLYIKDGDFKKAELYLLNSIKSNKNIISYNNLLNLYLKTSDKDRIKKIIIELLNYFPRNIEYLSLFNYLIENDKNRDELLVVFNDFLPENNLIDYYKLEFKLKFSNPFSVSNKKSIISNHKFNLHINSDNDMSIDDIFQNLDANPFKYKNHILISKKYLKSKQFGKAELYALSAFFLKDSKESVQTLIEVYKAIGNKKKLENLKILLIEKENNK